MTPASIAQYGALGVIALLLGQALISLLLLLRRQRHEQQVQAAELARLGEALETARLRRGDRGRETDAWNGFRKFEVVRKVDEGGGIASFYLEPHDRKSIPGFSPGQFLTFQLRPDSHVPPVVRCYSLSDAPERDAYRVTIKRIPPPRDSPDAPPGLVSNFFHERIDVGSIVDVKAPAGGFFLDVSERGPIVLLAGGVGITPLLSMLNAVADRGFNREVHLFYGIRQPGEMIMAEHFETLAQRNRGRFHMHVCLSAVAAEDLPDPAATSLLYHAGIVDVARLENVLPSNNYEFYICGPPPMMSALTQALSEWGVPASSVHYEAFGPASVPKSKADATAAAHSISFRKSGKQLAWDGTCSSLLEFAEKNGVVIDSGCRAGSCGSCLTAVKQGKVEYLRDPGEEPEPGSCLTCISVPATDLELDA